MLRLFKLLGELQFLRVFGGEIWPAWAIGIQQEIIFTAGPQR